MAKKRDPRDDKKRYRERRDRAFNLLGGRCCGLGGSPCPYGCVDWDVLEIDHIHGDGFHERNRLGGTSSILSVLKMGVEAYKKFQLLCANCHMKKTKINGEFRRGRNSYGHNRPLPLFD